MTSIYFVINYEHWYYTLNYSNIKTAWYCDKLIFYSLWWKETTSCLIPPPPHPKGTFSAGPGNLEFRISVFHWFSPKNNPSVPCWGVGCGWVATCLYVGGEGSSEGSNNLMWDFNPRFPIFYPWLHPLLCGTYYLWGFGGGWEMSFSLVFFSN